MYVLYYNNNYYETHVYHICIILLVIQNFIDTIIYIIYRS